MLSTISETVSSLNNMTLEQRNQVIDLCKQHIDEQGSVRVGWAAEKILGLKPQHNVLDKVAALLLENREYVKEPANPNFRYDWNVRRNPEFKKEKWTERNPIGFEIIKASITAAFSILVSVLLTINILDKKQDNQIIKNHQQSKSNLEDSISKISNISTDSSNKKMKTDTLK